MSMTKKYHTQRPQTNHRHHEEMTNNADSDMTAIIYVTIKLSVTVNPEIFARILFSQTALKHICGATNSRLGHDLHILVSDRVISAFRKDFIFTKLRSFAKIKPSRKFPNLQLYNSHIR